MFYVSSIHGEEYGITDTRDNVTEFYSFEKVCSLYTDYGVPIKGVSCIDGAVKVNISLPSIKRRIEENAVKVGTEIGDNYFRYLDKNIFGTITNCVFTVGHVITRIEKRKFKELNPYSYIHCKDYNGLEPIPKVFLAFLYRNEGSDYVVVDIKLGRKGFVANGVVDTVGFIKGISSIRLNVNDSNNTKIIADYCNNIAVKVKEFAMRHEQLLHILPQGGTVEQF